MRYYFEVLDEDRYTGVITMHGGRKMQFKHYSHENEDAYLEDIKTGEIYPIVNILSDGDTDLFICEV